MRCIKMAPQWRQGGGKPRKVGGSLVALEIVKPGGHTWWPAVFF